MLELNKKEKGNVNYAILILVLYSILALGVTFYLISVKNNKKDISSNIKIEENITNENKKTPDYSKIKRVSLTDKYYINNLKIENKSEYAGDIVNYSNGTPQYKVSINYPEISGLKDIKVQEKINNDIKNKIEELKDNLEIKDSEINNIYISADVMGNFSDVLSISFYKANFLENNDVKSKHTGLSFRLDTGEKLEFEDLFTEDASLKSIMSQSAYKKLAYEYATEAEGFDMFRDMNEFDYSELENRVYKFMNLYNQNPDIEFYFSETSIYAYFQDKLITIDMIDFDKYINIYNLVNSNKSLYTNQNKEKINYIFGTAIFEKYEYFDKISDNVFLGIFNDYKNPNDETYNELYTEYMKTYNQYKDKIIDAIKDYEKENEKSVIYDISYLYIDKYNDNLLSISADKIEIDDLDSQVDEVYAKASRKSTLDGSGAISFYELHDEYKTYNVKISEDENGILDISQEEIVSSDDV